MRTDADGRKVSLVDFNRSGAPLMEIVTDPDIRTAEQARRYAEELQLLLRTIGASDADMERGQMRVEANVSLRPRGTEAFGTRVEVKNMNSFRSVERAIDFEIDRQAAALDAGEPLRQETRGWSDDRGETYHMRSKETSDDYRYFPEPDLPPLHVDRGVAGRDPGRHAGAARRRAERATATTSGCGAYDAAVLVADPDATALFEATLAADPALAPKSVANWVTGEYLRLRNAASRTRRSGRAVELAAIVRRGRRTARSRARNGQGGPRGARRDGRRPRRPSSRRAASARSPTRARVGAAVDEVLAANPAAVADYRAGKVQAVGFLVGQVMKATRGQANAALVQAAVRERLGSRGARGGRGWDRSTCCCGGPASSWWSSATRRARGPWARYQALKARTPTSPATSRGGRRAQQREDRCVGGDGDPAPPGAGRRGDRDRRRRAHLPRASSFVEHARRPLSSAAYDRASDEAWATAFLD